MRDLNGVLVNRMRSIRSRSYWSIGHCYTFQTRIERSSFKWMPLTTVSERCWCRMVIKAINRWHTCLKSSIINNVIGTRRRKSVSLLFHRSRSDIITCSDGISSWKLTIMLCVGWIGITTAIRNWTAGECCFRIIHLPFNMWKEKPIVLPIVCLITRLIHRPKVNCQCHMTFFDKNVIDGHLRSYSFKATNARLEEKEKMYDDYLSHETCLFRNLPFHFHLRLVLFSLANVLFVV